MAARQIRLGDSYLKVSFYPAPPSKATMEAFDIPLAHCYRCGYTWTPRRSVVRLCARCKSPHFDQPKLRIPSFGGGLGVEDILGPHRRAIQLLARRYGAYNVRVFGSVARHSAGESSDVDLLVDFRGRARRSELREQLERLLGRSVDVVTDSSIHWFAQPQIVTEAVPL
jgi:uncharacterized protein